MMMVPKKTKHRTFRRNSGFKNKFVKYVICVEGRVTEKEYFRIFKCQDATIDIQIINNKSKSHPKYVFDKLKEYLANNELKPSKLNKAWMVIDRDPGDRSEAQLSQVFNDCLKHNYNFALSNPCFELWILFHFLNPSSGEVNTAKKCRDRLKIVLPNYAKNNVEINKLRSKIKFAIETAKIKDNPPCEDWPRKVGTTVYKLVEKLYQE